MFNRVQGGTWTITATAGPTSTPAVIQQNLSYAGLPASSGGAVQLANGSNFEDIGLDITTANSGSVYGSFILKVLNPGSVGAGDYIAHFQSAGNASTDYHSRVFVTTGSIAGSTFRVGIRNRSADVVQVDPTDRPVGTPVFVAFSYDFVAGATNDISRVWINPALGLGAAPAANATASAGGVEIDLTTLGRVGLRQGAGSTAQVVQLDELRVGTAWTDVAPNNAAVAEWSLYN